MPLISVVVVTWNAAGFVEDLLLSLKAQSCQDFELIIVDNQSTDLTLERVAIGFPDARVLTSTDNRGFAAGCNRGIAVAAGDWVLLLNPDTVLAEDFLERFTAYAAQARSDVGMVQPKILFKDGERINSTGIRLTRTGGGSDRSFGQCAKAKEADVNVFCPTAGAAFYRRDMMNAVALDSGVLDESYFLYWEDVDLGWRCRLAGWRAEYHAPLIIWHAYQSSARTLGAAKVREKISLNRCSSLGKNASIRFLLFCTPRTFYDLIRLFSRTGPKAMGRFIRAFAYGWRQRGQVSSLSVLRRVQVERSWAGFSD